MHAVTEQHHLYATAYEMVTTNWEEDTAPYHKPPKVLMDAGTSDARHLKT